MPAREAAALLLANFDAVPFDYVARQKIQGQHLNWFIVEQLPVVPPETYETVRFRLRTAGEIVREAVLELTHTAHNIGHVDAAGDLLPRFMWNEERRLFLRAKLDAVFFHLYGVTGRDDVRYVEKAGTDRARCVFDRVARNRWQEVRLWMFGCAGMSDNVSR